MATAIVRAKAVKSGIAPWSPIMRDFAIDDDIVQERNDEEIRAAGVAEAGGGRLGTVSRGFVLYPKWRTGDCRSGPKFNFTARNCRQARFRTYVLCVTILILTS